MHIVSIIEQEGKGGIDLMNVFLLNSITITKKRLRSLAAESPLNLGKKHF